MTDKELKRAGKKELLELLYAMSKELDRVREENSQLRSRIDALAAEGAKHISVTAVSAKEEQ